MRRLGDPPFVIPHLETSDVQLKGLLARIQRDPSISSWSIPTIASQASHVSPALGLLATRLMPSCGRRPL
jgi:hypothetical protein